MKTFSTEQLAVPHRVEFWNEVVCNTFTPLTVSVPANPFAARMRRVDLGDLRLAVAESSRAVVTHSRAQVSRCPGAYFMLHLQLSGESINQQTGRELRLSPGSLTLFDSTRPYRIGFCRPTSILVIRIPRVLMREYIACPEALTLVPLVPSCPASRLAARFIRHLWRSAEEITTESSLRYLTQAVMSLIAAAYSSMPEARLRGSGHAALVRIRLLECIEANLWNPELNPTAIAQMGRVSTRYLHLLFHEQGESVRCYVQRRRLEECARALRDPLRASKSVTEIACAQGFKSAAHFCRAFHESYGVTPTEFRKAAASPQTA